jgi:2-methylfumaryl-CoA hydratase
MKKTRTAKYFEAFRLGMKIQHATVRTLTESRCSLYIGLTGSRSALDTTQTDTLRLGFDRRALDDLLVFDSASGKSAPDISLIAMANHGCSDARFMTRGYPGDTLGVDRKVTGWKENSNRKSGVIYVRSSTKKQRGHDVLTWIHWVTVHKCGHGSLCDEAVAPPLKAVAPAEHLMHGAYSAGVRDIHIGDQRP